MSTIKNVNVTTSHKKNYHIHIERYESAAEVVDTCEKRQMTDRAFRDVKTTSDWDWCGCKSYEDAMEMMRIGYQPVVEEFKKAINIDGNHVKRMTFGNNIVGFSPIVPLALKNVPNCMVDVSIKPMEMKVLDVYYDITSSCGTSSEEIIDAGRKLLSAVKRLEMSGYRINLYGVQSYSDERSCDMMVVKLKSSNRPLDLKRLSFPLIHTAFFRVIGFDWYSKVPDGRYRSGYGSGLAYEMRHTGELQEMAAQVFGKNAVYLSGVKIRSLDSGGLEEVIRNGNS